MDTHASLETRNRLGSEGWELVSVLREHIQSGSAGVKTIETFYFKREIQPQKKAKHES